MLKLADGVFKTPMHNMIRILMDRADRMQEQMANVSRQMKILRKSQKRMLKIKNRIVEMKNVLMGLLVKWIRLRKESLS